MSGYINYKLRKFDMRWIARNKRVIFIGKTETGKSTLVKDLLYHHRKIPKGICISGTQDGIEDYSKLIPNIYIYEEYDKEIVEKLIKSQRKAKKEGRLEDCFFILDDCLYDDKWTKDKIMKYIFFNSRHDRILFLLTMQFPLGIPPALRANVDFVFILRENIISNRERIYKQYAGMFPSFDVFCSVMDQCTENYECLVIHNASKSNRFEDQVFWYKADMHDDFRIGSRKFWRYHDSRFNEGHDDERDRAELDIETLRARYLGQAGSSRRRQNVLIDKMS